MRRERNERGADRPERVAPREVEAMAVRAPALDEPRLAQRAELQRDRAERDVGHRSVDVPRGELAIPHQAEDLAPARGGDGGERSGVQHDGVNLDQTKMNVKPSRRPAITRSRSS